MQMRLFRVPAARGSPARPSLGLIVRHIIASCGSVCSRKGCATRKRRPSPVPRDGRRGRDRRGVGLRLLRELRAALHRHGAPGQHVLARGDADVRRRAHVAHQAAHRVDRAARLQPPRAGGRAARDAGRALRGRAELGTARSNNVGTLEAFGVDPTTTRAQWTESLQVVLACLTHDPFSHDGELWQVAPRTLSPPTVQKPHPPIYVSASGPETHAIAGRLGIGAMTGASIIGWHTRGLRPRLQGGGRRARADRPGRQRRPVLRRTRRALRREDADRAFEETLAPTVAFMRRMLGPGGMYESLITASPDYGYLAGVAAEAQKRMDDLEYIVSIAPYMSIGTPDFLIDRFRRSRRWATTRCCCASTAWGTRRTPARSGPSASTSSPRSRERRRHDRSGATRGVRDRPVPRRHP